MKTIKKTLLLIGCVIFLCTLHVAASDSVLELSRTGGYAEISDANADDLDYSKDFSVEVLTKIEPHSIGGRWASFIQKSGRRALYLESEPGFALGTNQGHLELFGQQIHAKVGDGTNHVTLGSPVLEGHVCAVMTWDSTEKELILYINGNEASNKSNTQINPLNIKNSYGLRVGIGTYGSLKRDIFMIRIWNRKLSSSEISSLYNNYNVTGQHILPSGFSENELKSEWLMQQTSDAIGSSGTTHIKDTKGTNQLELKDGAEISTGIGYLTVENPSNNATDVDKAVILRVTGGISDLGAIIRPLHYYFQIDESPTFDSPRLKESGWVVHYGKYKLILKPNTRYYWKVKVKDSSSPANESSYITTKSFTTEGPTDWYVRPGVYSKSASTPVPATGVYGAQDGTSYSNAWNGIREIVWGEDGVEAGDNLYVCGEHVYSTTSNDFRAWQAVEFIRESGFSEEYPITIRMDYPEDTGTLYGSNMGFKFHLGRSKYIKFYKGNFYGSTVGKERMGTTNTDIPVSTHIIFDSCTMIYGVTYWLYSGHDYWTFRNNDISHAGNGIYTVGRDSSLNDGWGASYLLIENNTFKHLGTTDYYHQDAHAVGVQGGRGHIIQGNYIEDTGSAIEFWTGYWPMKDMIVRNNFIKNIKVKDVTGGAGIGVSGQNRDDSLGKRTGFKIYNNIIMNTGIGATSGWHGSGIGSNNKDPVEIYNNIIINPAGKGIGFGVMNAPAQGAVYNNIVVNPGGRYIQIMGDPGDWSNFSCDYNLYYPATDFTTDFYFRESIDRDTHSILADPMFVAPDPQEPADFILRAGSPAIDAGIDIGLRFDFDGNVIPFDGDENGSAEPDIGAYEYYQGMRNQNLAAIFTVHKQKTASSKYPVTFDALQSYDKDGIIMNYSWDFGDGSTIEGKGYVYVTHEYKEKGSYQVTLTVTDNSGNKASQTQTVTIEHIGDKGVNEFELYAVNVHGTMRKNEIVQIQGKAAPGALVYAVRILDGNGNVLSINVKDGVCIDAEGNISGSIPIIEIIKQYPMLTSINIEVVVENGGIQLRAETGLIMLAPFETKIACYNNIIMPSKGITEAIIHAELAETAHLSIVIYDTQGREVKVIMDEDKTPGTYIIRWDGTKEGGSKVGSGIYLIHMKAGGYKKTKKIAVVK